MTQSQHPPIDPDTVAEIAPGEGAEPGSVEYGGSEIRADGVASGGVTADESATGEEPATAGGSPAADGPVTTEAGTFEDLPVAADEQIE
jgi:hypothetical protein